MKNKILFLGGMLMVFSILWCPLAANTPAIPWYNPPKKGTDPSYDEATYEKLKTLSVSVSWHNISLKAALGDLALQSRETDPDHLGIKFILKNASDAQKQIDMTIADVSLEDILGYLSAQTNLGIKIYKGEVVLLPLKEANQQEP